jgi:GT2 family glycosyltransferase
LELDSIVIDAATTRKARCLSDNEFGKHMEQPRSVDLSIIIVSWNTRDVLRQCLQSVYAQTGRISFETIVVDNGSTDGSVEMIKRDFNRVKLLTNTENRGFAAANNQALLIAAGRYLLLLNSDTIVLDQAIEKSLAFANVHPDAAVTGCRILNPDGTLQSSCFMFPSLLNLFLLSTYLSRIFPKSRFFGRERMSWWDRADAREVEVVTGCFMLVRREAVAEVGLMDERFFMYCEETDWCYRFRAKGWKNWFTPSAEIVHIGGASAAKLGTRRAQIQNRSEMLYFMKHWSKPRAFAGAFFLALFYVVRLIPLVSKRLVMHREADQKLIEHHWAGLKDTFFFFEA